MLFGFGMVIKERILILLVIMATTRLKLISDPAFDDFFKDSRLLGIVSSQKQYHLCWQINRALHLNFRMNSELEAIIRKNGKRCFFQIYEYDEPLRFTFHYLYSNHYKGEYLIPELKHIDFLWLLKGTYYDEPEINTLMNDIRRLHTVRMVMPLQASGLKSRSNLVV